jgi:hypothetical protein
MLVGVNTRDTQPLALVEVIIIITDMGASLSVMI